MVREKCSGCGSWNEITARVSGEQALPPTDGTRAIIRRSLRYATALRQGTKTQVQKTARK
jgi:hypothetical protein